MSRCNGTTNAAHWRMRTASAFRDAREGPSIFFENAKPTKPTIAKSVPTKIIQCGYCSPSRSAFISASPWHSIQRGKGQINA